MLIRLALDPPDILTVHLREGDDAASVAVAPADAGVRSLARALDDAMATGYGECFWPGRPGGQYWWIFKREAETLETVLMWTRGGASLWEHVFRATDGAVWVHEHLAAQIAQLRR